MEDNIETGLEKLTDTIGSVITGIRPPFKKNFLKAFGQLCTAAVDIPVAWLESKASEIRATTDARIQIIKGRRRNCEVEVLYQRNILQRHHQNMPLKLSKNKSILTTLH